MKTSVIENWLGRVLDGTLTAVQFLLWGPTGIGKSAIVRQVAASRGLPLIDLRLATQEVGDLIGLPSIEERLGGDGRKHLVTTWAAPSWFPLDSESRGILVLEEINRAPLEVRNAILQLLDPCVESRRLHQHRLPPGWLIVAAANPARDGYQTQDLCPALLARFIEIQVEFDPQGWIAWARRARIHGSLIRFVESGHLDTYGKQGAEVDPKLTPRALELLSPLLEHDLVPSGHLHEVLSGVVGPNAALALAQQIEADRRNVVRGCDVLLGYHGRLRERVLGQSIEENTTTFGQVLDQIGLEELPDDRLEQLRLCLEDARDEHRALVIGGLNKRQNAKNERLTHPVLAQLAGTSPLLSQFWYRTFCPEQERQS